MIDLLVAGGGPAGLGTAILAAQAGLRATVIEPRVGVIDKACGEGLMPPAVAALQAMGVAVPVSHPFLGVRYVDAGGEVEARFRAGTGLGVRRTVLHAALGERARELGVRVVEGRVPGFAQDADGVETLGIRARYGVVADGLHSPLRETLGLSLPPRLPPRLGIRRHFAMRPWSPWVEVHWSEHAEAYVTPVADDLVGIAILYRRGAEPPGRDLPPFERWLAGFPALAEKLGPVATQARGAGPFEQRVKCRVVGRVLLVGDAAGYLDPLTGEGIRLGLDCAAALVAAVRADRPQDYEVAWRRVARRYWWMTSALLWLGRHRWTRGLIVPVSRAVPWVFDRGLNLLAGGEGVGRRAAEIGWADRTE